MFPGHQIKSNIQEDSGETEPAYEPDPEGTGPSSPANAEDISERHADSPVGERRHEHWDLCVLQAAKCARACHLQAVEDLKDRGHEQQGDGHSLYYRILRVDSRDKLRNRKYHERRTRHEGCSQQDSHETRESRRM